MSLTLPFPKELLRPSLSKDQQKRLDTQSSDSGKNSPIALSRTPVLSLATPIETSSVHPSTSQQVQGAQPSPKGRFGPIQQFIRNSAKLPSKNPKYNRTQPNHPDFQPVLTTRTRQVYKL